MQTAYLSLLLLYCKPPVGELQEVCHILSSSDQSLPVRFPAATEVYIKY